MITINLQLGHKLDLRVTKSACRVLTWRNNKLIEEKYFKNYKLHREDGPAYVSHTAGLKQWFHEGSLHRLDGPAIESEKRGTYGYANYKSRMTNGYCEWCVNGLCLPDEDQKRLNRFKNKEKIKLYLSMALLSNIGK